MCFQPPDAKVWHPARPGLWLPQLDVVDCRLVVDCRPVVMSKSWTHQQRLELKGFLHSHSYPRFGPSPLTFVEADCLDLDVLSVGLWISLVWPAEVKLKHSGRRCRLSQVPSQLLRHWRLDHWQLHRCLKQCESLTEHFRRWPRGVSDALCCELQAL